MLLTVDSPSLLSEPGAAMAFREVRVFEVREVLRLWLAGEGEAADRLDRSARRVGRYHGVALALAV